MDMEGVEETTKSEAHLTSAAAFVEGGIQEACDDACSICLEAFCESDPSSVTSCKHEFHLQCILEWCQRSSQCPMCWQPLSLKDAGSQELLEAVETERSFRLRPSRNAAIFHHPMLGDFELQHLPIGTNDAELEEHIIQHLAAAMGRRQIARREGQRNRSSARGHPQILVFSSQPNAPTASADSSSPAQRGEGEPVSPISVSMSSSPANYGQDSPQLIAPASTDPQADSTSASASGSGVLVANAQGNSLSNRSPNQSSPSSGGSQDRAGPSDFQSFSESFKSKFNAVSMRYKESISKSTRGWKERFFSRNTTMADVGSEVRREDNAGIATVTRMMERLETRDNGISDNASVSNGEDHNTVAELNNQRTLEAEGASLINDTATTSTNMQTSCAASSGLS